LLSSARKFFVRFIEADTYPFVHGTALRMVEKSRERTRLLPDPLEALTDVVKSERAALAGIARKSGASAEDAVECVQDALCTLLSKVQRGELVVDKDAWRPLLATMVTNAVRNRRRRHDRALPHDDVDVAAPAADAPRADDLLANAEDQVRLRACIAELCEVQRSVVMLRLLGEEPGEDVAAALGITRGHVDVLAHRAKANLKVCMRRGRDERG
jgi:RNA polymerase sigma-70 factor (ECF subfamily)